MRGRPAKRGDAAGARTYLYQDRADGERDYVSGARVRDRAVELRREAGADGTRAQAEAGRAAASSAGKWSRNAKPLALLKLQDSPQLRIGQRRQLGSQSHVVHSCGLRPDTVPA